MNWTSAVDPLVEMEMFPTSGIAGGNEDILDIEEGTGFEEEEEF